MGADIGESLVGAIVVEVGTERRQIKMLTTNANTSTETLITIHEITFNIQIRKGL